MRSKKMSIKPLLNVKITLNLIANVRRIKKSVVCNIFFILNILSKDGIIFIFVRRAVFLRSKNVVNFTKTCFLRMRNYVQICYDTSVYYMIYHSHREVINSSTRKNYKGRGRAVTFNFIDRTYESFLKWDR